VYRDRKGITLRAARLRIVAGVIVAHITLSGLARAENGGSVFLVQRKAGIAQAERMVIEHIAQDSKSVEFRKVRYYEHHSTIAGRRVLTAQAICGQVKISAEAGASYRRFLSWIFLATDLGQYNEDKYVVAIHDPQYSHDLYAKHHSSICQNSGDGASIEANINASQYQ
jgi:hypothetical protein